MAGLEPARAGYGPTDFKSVASAISPQWRDSRKEKVESEIEPERPVFQHRPVFQPIESHSPLASMPKSYRGCTGFV